MIGSVLLALALTVEPTPPPLAPVGPWIVRAEESMCLLERNYTVDGRRISLIFQPLLDLPNMEMFIVAADTNDKQYQGNFSAAVASVAMPYTGRYFSVVPPKAKARLTRLTVQRRLLNELKDGDTLHVRAKPVDQSFTIVRPEKARAALQNCTNDLKKAWGINDDVASRAEIPPEGKPGHYFGPDAYPREAMQQGIYGRVIVLLNIDPTGAVSNCRIVSSAGKALNEGTCLAAKRIRFKPARDKDDKPLPSTYVLPVRWVLPGSPG